MTIYFPIMRQPDPYTDVQRCMVCGQTSREGCYRPMHEQSRVSAVYNYDIVERRLRLEMFPDGECFICKHPASYHEQHYNRATWWCNHRDGGDGCGFVQCTYMEGTQRAE